MNVAEVNKGVLINETPKKEALWNKNYFLLWQGQLVSSLGNQAYSLALGFWILAVTGSTALYGTLVATSTLPGVLLSPISGAIVDRLDRKKILVWTDLIRGFFVTIVAIGAYRGWLEIWMVFATGIILGLCGSFFGPAASSSIPDLVPKSKLVQANSFFQMIYSATNMLGNMLGGIIYAIVGAPFLFLFNGLSFLFSAGTETFIDIPKIERKGREITIKEDLKAGAKFVWNFTSLRNLFITASFSNFFGSVSFVLMIPLFTLVRGFNSAQYGFAISAMGLGMLLGMLYTSAMKIKPSKRYVHFVTGGILTSLSFGIFPFVPNIYIITAILFFAGIGNALINVFIGSVIQMTTPAEMRGKVFGLLGTLSQGLTPIAMALGGFLGVWLPIPLVILGCMVCSTIAFMPVILSPKFKRFINFNPDEDLLEDVM